MNNRKEFLTKLAALMDEYEVESFDIKRSVRNGPSSLEVTFEDGGEILLGKSFASSCDVLLAKVKL